MRYLRLLPLSQPSTAQRAIAFLIDWLILAVAVYVAAALVSGIHLDGLKSILIVAGILGLLNALIKRPLQALTLLLSLLTLGLFVILLNTGLLLLTDWIAGQISGINFEIDGFWDALLGAVIISVVTFVVSRFVDSRRVARDVAP